MQTESALKRSGRWTSFTSRRVNAMRRELVSQLGREPVGTERILLDLAATKFGILLILSREIKRRPIVDEAGNAASLIDRNVLAWQHSLERTLALLFDGKDEDLPSEFLQGIDPKYKSENRQ